MSTPPGPERLPAVPIERRVQARRADDPPAICARCPRLASARKLQSDAEAATRHKDDFISVVSHELRTPLSAILGWARLLATKALDPPTTLTALNTIERNAILQKRLIEDLLDLEGIASGRLYLHLAPVDLAEVVVETCTALRPAAEAKQVSVIVLPHGEVPRVLGDGLRLRQVVSNLMSNAVKFSPKGGHVAVRLQARDDSEIILTMTDDGPGVPDAFLPHVFERFSQAGRGDDARAGVGLGLYIVKQLVEAHGGTVVAEHAPGHGAAFTVRLPQAN